MSNSYWSGTFHSKPKTIFHKWFNQVKWYIGWYFGEKVTDRMRKYRGKYYLNE